jgi:hypothetical protein
MKKTKRHAESVSVHVTHSFREASEFDAAFWRRAGVDARFAAAWSMVGDYLKMRGTYAGEPRLRRSVCRSLSVSK